MCVSLYHATWKQSILRLFWQLITSSLATQARQLKVPLVDDLVTRMFVLSCCLLYLYYSSIFIGVLLRLVICKFDCIPPCIQGGYLISIRMEFSDSFRLLIWICVILSHDIYFILTSGLFESFHIQIAPKEEEEKVNK